MDAKNKKVVGGLVIAAVVIGGLTLASSAFAAEGGSNAPPAPPKPDPNANDAKYAQQANGVFGAALATASAAVIASSPHLAPFVATAAGTVTGAWQKLSTHDKANVWQGKA